MKNAKPGYEVIADYIKNDILNSSYKVGDKIPSERSLSQKYEVSRSTIREAVRSLENSGLLLTKHGGGTYVKGDFSQGLYSPLSMISDLNKIPIRQIMEFRTMYELNTASLAAIYRSEDQLEELKNIIDKMQDEESYENFKYLDLKLHKLLAQMTHNELIENSFDSSIMLFEHNNHDFRVKLLHDPLRFEAVKKQHLKIYEAIKNRDPKLAQEKMRDHMEFLDETLEIQKSSRNFGGYNKMDFKIDGDSIYLGNSKDDYSALIHFVKDGDTLNIDHTLVKPELQGKGIAAKLLEEVAKYARKNNFKVSATCSYAKEKLENDDSYEDIRK